MSFDRSAHILFAVINGHADTDTRSGCFVAHRLPLNLCLVCRGLCKEDQLPRIKCFSESTGRIRFDSPDAHQALKSILRKPMLIALRFEAGHQILDLTVANLAIERHEEIGRTEVAVVLRDFIFEDKMIPPSVPGQLVDDAVILVQIFARVGQDQIRRESVLQVLEEFLNLNTLEWEEAVAEIQDRDVFLSRAFQKEFRAPAGLTFTLGFRAKNHPMKFQIETRLEKLQDCASATNLDVVRVSAEN